MRLHRRFTRATLPVLAASALLVPLAPAQAADPAPAPRDSRPAAAQALERALDVLSGALPATDKAGDHARADVTLALLDLRKQLPFLDREDRKVADRVFARPDGTPTYEDGSPGESDADIDLDAVWDTNERAAAQIDCTADACVHWVPAGTLNDSSQPSRHGATATQAQVALTALDHSLSVETSGALGFDRPAQDFEDGAAQDGSADGTAGYEGANSQVDVYLSDILTADGGAFGYAVPERYSDDSFARATGSLVVDNDMAEAATTSTTAEELVQVTMAHELFHVIQFAYDFYESGWFMESTATWMEEQVYDDVNDNRAYIPTSSLVYSQMPLDTFNGSFEYGSWVFHELYTHMLKNDNVVREAWEYAARGSMVYDQASADKRVNFRWALDNALSLHGWNLARAFSSFGGSSIAPQITRVVDGVATGVYYPEGKEGNYPSAKPTGSWTFSTAARGIDWRQISLKHWGGATAQFTPNSTLAGAWKLAIKIDNPATQSAAYAITFYKDGTAPRLMSLVLNSSGDASVTVPFDYSKVAKVVIYQGNTSPSDGRVVKFKASTFK